MHPSILPLLQLHTLVSSNYDIVNDELERTWTDAAVTYSLSPIQLSGQPDCGKNQNRGLWNMDCNHLIMTIPFKSNEGSLVSNSR